MFDDPDPGPLASVAFYEDELALISPDGPVAELAIDDGTVPVLELAGALRELNPRAVAIVPIDPMPRDQSAYDRAHGAIAALLTLLGIAAEHPPRIVGNRTWH